MDACEERNGRENKPHRSHHMARLTEANSPARLQLALATRLGIGASHRKPWTWTNPRLRLYGLRSWCGTLSLSVSRYFDGIASLRLFEGRTPVAYSSLPGIRSPRQHTHPATSGNLLGGAALRPGLVAAAPGSSNTLLGPQTKPGEHLRPAIIARTSVVCPHSLSLSLRGSAAA